MEGDETPLEPQMIAGLYVQHADALRAFLWGVLRDTQLVQDALQAAFAKLLEHGGGVAPAARKAWLYKVAYNEAPVLRRKQAVRDGAVQKLGPQQPRHAAPEHDLNLLRYELVERIREALAELPEPQRAVIQMRMYQEHTFAEIAKRLRIPLSTVLTRMRAGLAKLRQILQEDHDDSA